EIEYVLVRISKEDRKEYVLLAEPLVESAMKRWGIDDYKIVASSIGEAFENLLLKHPFLDREVPVILSDHVTVDSGTGAVHIAPAHGQEDYVVGSRYGLAIHNPVNDNGVFFPGTPFFEGQHVFKVTDHLLNVLEKHEALIHYEKIEHSYPHCWRHK